MNLLGSDKELQKMDKSKSIVSRFSVFVLYKLAVSTAKKKKKKKKNNCVGCFNFRQ